jgi:hypothetical protein
LAICDNIIILLLSYIYSAKRILRNDFDLFAGFMTVYDIFVDKPANDNIKQIAIVEYTVGKKNGTNAKYVLRYGRFSQKELDNKAKIRRLAALE